MWNCDFFDLCIAAINGHYGECNLLIEPALAAASRIQPEDAIRHLLGVFMRMTVDHYIRVVQVFGHKLPVMNHKESALLNLKGQTFWYVLCPFFIVIAANDVDRRDFLQSVNDFRFASGTASYASPSLTLNFTHQMVRVIIKVYTSPEYGNALMDLLGEEIYNKIMILQRE